MEISELLELMDKRRSCRNYLDREVSKEMLDKCLEAARLAPSSCNKQPWRFAIVRDQETRRKICREALLPGIKMPWAETAPVLVVLGAEPASVPHKIAPLLSGIKYHLIDIGIAGEHFVLAAEAQGLGSCWIGWFREKPVKKILNIPRKVQLLSLITIGFPAEISEPRERLPMDRIAGYDSFPV